MAPQEPTPSEIVAELPGAVAEIVGNAIVSVAVDGPPWEQAMERAVQQELVFAEVMGEDPSIGAVFYNGAINLTGLDNAVRGISGFDPLTLQPVEGLDRIAQSSLGISAIAGLAAGGSSLLVPRLAAPVITVGDISLAIVEPSFVPDGVMVLKNATSTANSAFAANPALVMRYLKEGEALRVGEHPRMTPMYYGLALERHVAEIVADTGMFRYAKGGPGPDFVGVGPAAGRIFDITTWGQAADHVGRSYGSTLECVIYRMPTTITVEY
jgi:hypothetical protein